MVEHSKGWVQNPLKSHDRLDNRPTILANSAPVAGESATLNRFGYMSVAGKSEYKLTDKLFLRGVVGAAWTAQTPACPATDRTGTVSATNPGISVSAETLRRWVHEVGWVWKRAKLVAKDDDPQRVDRLARICASTNSCSCAKRWCSRMHSISICCPRWGMPGCRKGARWRS